MSHEPSPTSRCSTRKCPPLSRCPRIPHPKPTSLNRIPSILAILRACGIDQHKSLHAVEDLFHARRRLVSRIGPEFQTHQPISILAQVCRASLLAVIVVKKSIGQGLHDAQRALGSLLLLRMLAAKLLGIAHQARQVIFLALHLFWRERLVVIGNRHARHGAPRLHIEPGLRTLRSLLARPEHVLD